MTYQIYKTMRNQLPWKEITLDIIWNSLPRIVALFRTDKVFFYCNQWFEIIKKNKEKITALYFPATFDKKKVATIESDLNDVSFPF